MMQKKLRVDCRSLHAEPLHQGAELPPFGKKAYNASKLVEYLYQKPIISINDVSEALAVSKPTANILVKEFEQKGILRELTGYQRNKLFVFEQYLDIYSAS